jgi:hypothetical protein
MRKACSSGVIAPIAAVPPLEPMATRGPSAPFQPFLKWAFALCCGGVAVAAAAGGQESRHQSRHIDRVVTPEHSEGRGGAPKEKEHLLPPSRPDRAMAATVLARSSTATGTLVCHSPCATTTRFALCSASTSARVSFWVGSPVLNFAPSGEPCPPATTSCGTAACR